MLTKKKIALYSNATMDLDPSWITDGEENLAVLESLESANKGELRKQSKEWAWTIYGEISFTKILETLDPRCSRYAFQLEMCPTTKKLHYQGQMSLSVKARFHEVVKWFPDKSRVRATRNVVGSELYCQKGASRIEGPWTKGPVATPKGGRPKKEEDEPLELDEPDRAWQQEILAIFDTKPDKRTIYWYWEPDGNAGKTCFAKYVCATRKALYVNGKEGDILYAAAEKKVKIVIVDVKKSQSDVPYSAIESLKNGIFFSGKYESKDVLRNSPHVVVFSNRLPELEFLSKDRWVVRRIEPAVLA
ncbi:replication associated protein [Antarctic virus COCH21_111]|nr:replication associated protein [Antarctic virus COCH21_111]